MINRSNSFTSRNRRLSPDYSASADVKLRDRNFSKERNERERLPMRTGRRTRSRSPYRASYVSDSRDQARSRSPKRRRQRSSSSSSEPRKRGSREETMRSRRRTGSSRSPHRHRSGEPALLKRSRDDPSSRRPAYSASAESYKHSRRRSSGFCSPQGHRHRSREKPPRSKHGTRHSPPVSPPPYKRSKAPLPSQQDAFTGDTAVIRPDDPLPVEKQKPNYAPTGALARETNTVAGTSTVLKYNEPPESRLPPASAPWRMYIFKGEQELEKLDLHTRTCWLFGRERAVADIPIEHPSCSKQHAVVQFRYTEKRGEFGDRKGGVKPYIIDLDSANGTMLNGDKVEGRRYMELRTGDVLKFGESTRDYVLLLPPNL